MKGVINLSLLEFKDVFFKNNNQSILEDINLSISSETIFLLLDPQVVEKYLSKTMLPPHQS